MAAQMACLITDFLDTQLPLWLFEVVIGLSCAARYHSRDKYANMLI